jgi:hypothetical protein
MYGFGLGTLLYCRSTSSGDFGPGKLRANVTSRSLVTLVIDRRERFSEGKPLRRES